MTTRSHCLLFHKRSTDWDSPLGYKQVISHYTRRISLLLTLVLGFTSDSCNNNDMLLVVGYNYNILYKDKTLLIVYVVIRNTELLPELDFMSYS